MMEVNSSPGFETMEQAHGRWMWRGRSLSYALGKYANVGRA